MEKASEIEESFRDAWNFPNGQATFYSGLPTHVAANPPSKSAGPHSTREVQVITTTNIGLPSGSASHSTSDH